MKLSSQMPWKPSPASMFSVQMSDQDSQRPWLFFLPLQSCFLLVCDPRVIFFFYINFWRLKEAIQAAAFRLVPVPPLRFFYLCWVSLERLPV